MSKSAFERPYVRGKARRLHVVFGDQLDDGPLSALDKEADVVLMMEVAGESKPGPSHATRTALFLAAMRHFARELADDGFRVEYVRLDDAENTQDFAGEIRRAWNKLGPEKLTCVLPGEWRVLDMFQKTVKDLGVEHEVLPDPHFYTTPEEFGEWAADRKELTMEYFYREQRRRFSVLVTGDGDPAGGRWNFDADNREAFESAPSPPKPYTPRPDAITREVIELVQRRLPDLPGKLDAKLFRWPVTRREARRALADFVENRLARFGRFQDAMWTAEHFLYHALLSSSLNLKLLDPRECVEAAVAAHGKGAPIQSVEGFVRQILGWREFIRGVYWTQGRSYRDGNSLRQYGDLPDFYWTGETDMHCMRQCLAPVLESGYGHHIPRLMVLGNFALTSGVHPRAIGDWFYGMFVDAVDWVTTPNTIGMAMHADGGVVGSKPYAASGKYVKRMGSFCGECRYDVEKRDGEDACPFNVFYWDFLLRNEDALRKNRRMGMTYRNVDRLSGDQQEKIGAQARRLRKRLGVGSVSRA